MPLRLVSIALGFNDITDAGIKDLVEFDQISELHLNNTKITDASVASLKKLQHLSILSLGKTEVTEAAARDLRIELPNCQILR